MKDTDVATLKSDLVEFFSSANAFRSILILVVVLIITYVLSRFLARGIIKLAQIIGTKSDGISDREKQIRYRQIETYLSITVATVRALVVAVAAYLIWLMVSPGASSGAAAVGASAFFIVIAGQTLGTILRDITAGASMITEGWFHVGDHVKIEPFIDLAGVVERFTLRSTKIRSLSGEEIWVHNQHIQAVHVTKEAARTFAVDVFTRDPELAQAAIQEVIDAVPAASAMVRSPLKIKDVETWNENLSHIVVQCRVAPGREWLIENFFINALIDVDSLRKKNEKIFVYPPTARYADPIAERKFRRAIR